MLNFIENFLFKIDLKVVSIMKRKSVYTKCRKEKVKSKT